MGQRLNNAAVKRFCRIVLGYYRRHGRSDLPWRRTRNPYCILVSEFMLQQTQVPRVLERYPTFIARFPGFDSLDKAPSREVLAAWSGLGYNRRALYLKQTAGRVMAELDGILPSHPVELAALPGIGPATAGAIAAFAFGAAHPFIETNIRAVFIHHFFRDRSQVRDTEIMPLVERTLDRADPRTWYSALMDYGTMLKGRLPNPSRRSAHHTRQGTFEGSDRQARGLIIKALTRRNLGVRGLQRETGLEITRLRRNIDKLIAEGLVVRNRRSFSL
jgi:A/G-specific adenine glycosylase